MVGGGGVVEGMVMVAVDVVIREVSEVVVEMEGVVASMTGGGGSNRRRFLSRPLRAGRVLAVFM